MERAVRATGILLLLASLALVGQVFAIVKDVVTLPDAEIHATSTGDLVADIPGVPSRDIGALKYPFLLLHLWLPLAAWVYTRQRPAGPHRWTPLRVVAVASVLVILAGHAGALWLASQGTRIGFR